MENREPIFVYDSRTQFTKPMFVVYEYELIDPFLKKMGIDDFSAVWKRPDWVMVTKQRMHPYEPNPYKVPGSSSGKSGNSSAQTTRDKNSAALISSLSTKNKELEKLNFQLTQRAAKAETDLATWKASNMDALRDLAVEILTKK